MLADFILSVFFPPKCPYCSKIISRNLNECIVCRAQFPKYPRIEPVPSGEICVAPFSYDSTVRQAIINYKFKGKRYNAKSFSCALCGVIENIYKDMDFDVVCCVPLSAKRKRQRGFNQSEIIARNVAEYFEKPFESLLIKKIDNKEQHSLSAEDRIKNVIGVYSPKNLDAIKGRKILIIDDVATTGNTLAECCKVLKDNGAEFVICATAAISGESKLEYKI